MILKKIVLVIIIATLILLLTGCSLDYGELNGFVVNKEYKSGYSTVTFMYTGKTTIPISQYHPERWKIEIQKEEGRSNKNNLDKCYRRRI